MCTYDFDFMCDDLGLVPWEPRFGKCDCGYQPEPGEVVAAWVAMEDDSYMEGCPTCECEGTLFDDLPGVSKGMTCWTCDGEGEIYGDDPYADEAGCFCPQCNEARKLLHEWCDGMYSYSRIPYQIIEHWLEDEVYRSVPFARLVNHAKHRWGLKARVSAEAITSLVKASIERVR